MTAQEKMNMIGVLEFVTGYNYIYLKNLSDEKLQELYKQRVG
ncbi:BH0509 family protein [Metabacillus dongyingensis]